MIIMVKVYFNGEDCKHISLNVGRDGGGSLLGLLLHGPCIVSPLPDDADLDLGLLLYDVTEGHRSSADVHLWVLRSGGPH